MSSKKKVRDELKQLRHEIALLNNEIKSLTAVLQKDRGTYTTTHSTYRPSWNEKKW